MNANRYGIEYDTTILLVIKNMFCTPIASNNEKSEIINDTINGLNFKSDFINFTPFMKKYLLCINTCMLLIVNICMAKYFSKHMVIR